MVSSEASESMNIFFYISLSFVALGFIGNILMFAVFGRPQLAKLSLSLYMRSMALVNLYTTLNWIKIFYGFVYNYYLINESEFFCKSVMYTIYVAGPLSAWLQAAASLDRLLTIVYPARFKIIEKTAFQIAVLSFIVLYNSAFYFHLLFDQNLTVINSTDSNSTVICDSYAYSLLFISDLINSALLPFIVMLASSLATYYGVVRARNRMKKFTDSRRANRIRMRDAKFGITMVILNLVFVLLNAPNPVINIITTYIDFGMETDLSYILQILFLFFYYVYYMMSFYVQLVVNSLIRKQILAMLYFSSNNRSISVSTSAWTGKSLSQSYNN